MKNFAAEFRALSAFYTKLAEDINKTLITEDSQNSNAIVKAALQHRELLEQIPRMEARIAELANDWVHSRIKLDPAARTEADAMAADAQSQALRLHQLCSIHTQKLQAIHDEIRHDLAELAKGSRFAKVLKPVQHNYPKFIDSCC
jgi:hypothetical protein